MTSHNPGAGRGFEVILASPPEHEELTAEIYFDGKFVALISCDHGLDHLQIETPSTGLDEGRVSRQVELEGFLRAVEVARRRLQGTLK